MNMRKQMLFLPVLGVVERGWGRAGFSCLRQCHCSAVTGGELLVEAVTGPRWILSAFLYLYSLNLYKVFLQHVWYPPAVPPCFSSAVTPVPLSFSMAPFPRAGGWDNNSLLSTRVCLQQRLNWPCYGKKDCRAIFAKGKECLEVNTAFQ